ncbi:hypothetical protein SAMN02746041_01213 [Desulfacinum hydrothermale DSM 13146]|uniref:Putative nickel insertion protein n=1 Tax=Desulfacinum hydrothermale DSM 13146 TaxID=1121390 RepID=A0A1W1XCC8_9BACT|nr:nickel pincer cofactor biosynthesis protein LarC [Desulfacinum hydrothermale]SMC21547.1 hypothetical protein SAMN02746041_01213 [Desulfacinum hydrothermale DSM 13146]
MRIAYFDAFSGVSGDMILGALLDAGFPKRKLESGLRALNLPGWDLKTCRESRGAITGTRLVVLETESQPHRHYRDLKSLLQRSELPDTIKETSLRILRRLAEAEARVHGMDPDQVHFHEVGAVDTLVDIVGAALGLEHLAIEEIVASPLPLGHGFVECSHGRLPLPSPATVALLEGVPIRSGRAERELVTPTGAAILSTICRAFGPIPAMTLEKVGYGVGRHPEPNPPNVLRLMVGRTAEDFSSRPLLLLETHIDDMNPEFYDHLLEGCLRDGALDVCLVPMHMKKNRPAVLVRVLAEPERKDTILRRLFSDTSTLGVRWHTVERAELPRRTFRVATAWGPVTVKEARAPDGSIRIQPEYEDCKRAARENNVSILRVYEEAKRLARAGDA